jgi:hypothetical protein
VTRILVLAQLTTSAHTTNTESWCQSPLYWLLSLLSVSEPGAEPGGHVYPPLLPHAPVVGGLGEAEVTVGHLVRTHWPAGPLPRTLAGAGGPLGPLREGAGCSGDARMGLSLPPI